MKGFKHTGNGPKYGSFSFPAKAGFGPSSGSVKNIPGYTRKAPKRRAVGGLVEDNIVEAPGFSDYAKGGPVKSSKTGKGYKPSKKSGHSEENAMFKKTSPVKKARGGKVPGVSDPMSAREAMSGSVGFNRTPKIR
jgi:hypothetical protein